MTGVGFGSGFAPGTGKYMEAVFFSPTFMVWPHAFVVLVLVADSYYYYYY
jgi:hypothetical protein